MNFPKSQGSRGFSLIEVLVAVVIMSVGLLALASLQMSLIRSSGESKTQSVAASVAKEQLESLRAFTDLSDYASSVVDGSYTRSVGGVTYTVATTVNRYVLDDNSDTFVSVANDATEAALSADGTHDFVLGRDFKKVQVTVSWTDLANATQRVVLDDIVDGLNPADSAKLVKTTANESPRSVQVVITDPSTEAGVIPIAIGDNTDTAATNPRPEIAGNNNNQRVIETRFDIYTYSALSGGDALAQSRVETVVVGCTCDTANAPSDTTSRGYRPTYWNGIRYVAPTLTTYVPAAGHANLGNNDPPESDYCDVCCRDHEDPTGVAGAKFDPWRSTHTHYGLVNGSLVAVGGSQTQYEESCRLIRTDGIFRVAADFNDEYFNLLPALNDGTTYEYAPTDSAVSNYQDMVLAYLNSKVVTPTDSSDVPTASSYNDEVGSGDVATLEAANGIDYRNTNLTIQRSNDHKWMHSRGLYVDYLEKEALTAINDAKADCVTNSCTDAEKQAAVLKVLPFTSINVTEIANWTPEADDNVIVTNFDFLKAAAQAEPVRGNATPGVDIPSNPPVPAAVGTAELRNSNSGLALLREPIDNDETSKSDYQPFEIPNGTPSGTSGSYTITISGYPTGNSATISPAMSASPFAICNPKSSGSGAPNPYSCTADSIGVATTLTVGHYNYQVNSTSKDSVANCTGPSGNATYSPQGNDSYTIKTCRNYAVSSATLNGSSTGVTIGSVANDGNTGETTPVSFTILPDGASIALTFTGPQETTQPLTCTYTLGSCNGNNCTPPKVFNVSSPDCP